MKMESLVRSGLLLVALPTLSVLELATDPGVSETGRPGRDLVPVQGTNPPPA